MNLPRHTLTSHGPEPVFVSAHFSRVALPASHREKWHTTSHPYAKGGKYRSQDFGHAGESSHRTQTRSGVRSRDAEDHVSKQTDTKGKGKARGVQYDTTSAERRRPSTGDSGQADSSASQPTRQLLTCATRSGFFVAEAESSVIKARRDFSSRQGGLAHACVVDGSSLVALVGGGRVPRFAPNKVVLWDEDASDGPSTRQADDARTSEDTETVASPAPSVIFSISQEETDDAASQESAEASSPQDDVDASLSHEGAVENSSELELGKPVATTSSAEPADAPRSEEIGDGDVVASVILPGEEEEAVRGAHQSDAGLVLAPLDQVAADVGITASSASLSASTASQSEPITSNVEPPRDSTEGTSLRASATPVSTLKGKAIAELEFGETVRSIKIDSFPLSSTPSESEDASRLPHHDDDMRASVMLVTLRSRIVIFEIGKHLSDSQQGQQSWGILQRAVVEIHPNAADCNVATAHVADTDCILLAMPGRQRGHVQMLCLSLSHTLRTSRGSSIGGSSSIIAAHSSSVARLALSHDGQLLCTASERGTLLRLWSTQLTRRKDGAQRRSRLQSVLVGELRRGSSPATILDMSIDPDKRLIAAASDRGTVHLFDLADLQKPAKSTSAQKHGGTRGGDHRPRDKGDTDDRPSKGYIPGALYDFSQNLPATMMPQLMRSQWSFAQYRIPLQVFSHRAAEGGPQFEGRAPPAARRSRRAGDNASLEDEMASAIGEAIVPAPPQKVEGGWDVMRGRLDDIRRGEKTIEERMWLTWIRSRPDASEEGPPASQGGVMANSAFQLVAITSSGSHYRLGVRLPDNDGATDERTDSDSAAAASVVLDMYRSDAKSKRARDRGATEASTDSSKPGSKASAKDGSCWLIEHTRFGLRDPWVD